ncbi:MAG: hypothetical protein R2865_11545 [Deinococcales bacterium]
MGAIVEKFLFRPVIRRSLREESTMLLAAALAFLLDALILLIFGEKQRGVPKLINGVLNLDFRLIMPYDRILIGVLAILLIIAFVLYMQHSKTGRALRACPRPYGSPVDGGSCRPLFDDRLCPWGHARWHRRWLIGDDHRCEFGHW